ncbi:P-loop NTPase fold protein [Arcobacter arenosus]|uniref:KAP NTPase domain-containing protein n=1 Tax=Arcobacter arenosus TaxID=2576037 RepID=A0A5R8Y1Z0_9BACT|nr:P-loop NTPase fold protein [Arcobacter arenosus]TLP38485.1 hypothetical protein FDK22_08435 [Arcobacter arenosus]
MANQKELKDYLLGTRDDKGYLRKDDNNNKVIMLSGKWGSGKTHFWQNVIEEELKKDLKDKSYSYVSLYGKSTIEEIENDIFSQVFFHSIGGENLVTKTTSTFTKYTKRYGKLASSFFDLSELVTALEEESKDNEKRIALERLNNGGIICFDDFERKSKEIDLNDLFGFITQLSLNFKCKIVIILNDDVFKGKEKEIFSSVKEKTVSKYLYYKPSIEELFGLIYNSNKKYKKLDKDFVLKTIEETEELNARIYIQVLDNLLEWIEKVDDDQTEVEVLRCLILVNINFIIYHTMAEKKDRYYIVKGFYNLGFDYNSNRLVGMSGYKEFNNFDEYINYVIENLVNREKSQSEFRKKYQELIEENITIFKSEFFINKWDIAEGIELDIFNKINNFIETGILIKESN